MQTPYDKLRSAQLCQVSNSLIRQRLLATGAFNFVSIAALVGAGFPPVRLALVSAFGLATVAWQLVRYLRGVGCAKGGAYEELIFRSQMFNLAMQVAIVALTGGSASPYIAFLFPTGIAVLFTFGRGRRSTIVLWVLALSALVFAALPSSWAGPTLPRPHFVLLALAAQLTAVYYFYTHVLAVTDAYARAGDALWRVREDLVDNACERARSLELVGAKVAHELKNPLSAIKGLAQLLDHGAHDGRTRERLAVIAGEVTRMEAILRDYLSFSRPLEDLRPQRVDLVRLVDEVLAVLEGRAHVAGVALLREGVPVALVGDERRLKEALLNLVSNSLEATPAGGSVTVALRGRGGAGAEVVVRDTGRGIPPSLLPRIGSPFFTTREGGTGLGVVLARAVILQHGGEMNYASELGRGTIVTIALPSRPTCRSATPSGAISPPAESLVTSAAL